MELFGPGPSYHWQGHPMHSLAWKWLGAHPFQNDPKEFGTNLESRIVLPSLHRSLQWRPGQCESVKYNWPQRNRKYIKINSFCVGVRTWDQPCTPGDFWILKKYIWRNLVRNECTCLKIRRHATKNMQGCTHAKAAVHFCFPEFLDGTNCSVQVPSAAIAA